jgi:hypothetical protein
MVRRNLVLANASPVPSANREREGPRGDRKRVNLESVREDAERVRNRASPNLVPRGAERERASSVTKRKSKF